MKSQLKLVLATGSILFATSAIAADLPRRSPAPAPVQALPVFTWQGFYVGLQAGYQWGRTTGSLATAAGVPPIVPYNYGTNGFVGGIHAGYNFQRNSLVYGIEADLEYSGVRGSQVFPALPIGAAVVLLSHRTREQWQGSLRARLGVAFDRTLVYATGGLAYNNRRYSTGPIANPNLASHTAGTFGWTIGAGIQHAINYNWSVRGEYRYSQYPGKTGIFPAINLSDRVGSYKTHTVRVGLSYRFGGPAAPVVAKY